MAGVLPIFEAVLFYYAALDLMSQPYLYRAQLDQITVTGFLRSRLYRTDRIVNQFQELMLKGISVPTYEVSAMTMRNVMRFWVKAPEPMMRILKGNLQELWIQPLQSKIEALGGQIRLEHSLTRLELQDGKVARLHFTTANGGTAVEQIEPDRHVVISAIPAEKLAALFDDALYAAAPELANIQYLRARPMAAFNLYMKLRIEDVPKGHVNLLESRYGISFLDVSQFWSGYDTTVLNCIASDTLPLAHLSTEVALAALMEDFRRYFPKIRDEDIAKVDFQNHVQEPLFMNNVGNWAYRPTSSTQIPNFFLAGDYCRSAIDLVCMEGALSTGLHAAEAVRTVLDCPDSIEVLAPEQYPTWFLILAKVVLAPVALLAFVGAYITARLRGESIRQ